MNLQTVYAAVFLSIFLLLVLVAHVLYKYFKVSSEDSRKFLHVSGGLLALCSPLFFSDHWWVLILCSLAFLLLLFTYLKRWLAAVHQTKRKSIGSILFPIPVYICFLVAANKSNLLLFYLPVSFMTISDTAAEWAGKKWGRYSIQFMKGQKTLAGSLAFAICSFAITMIWGMIFQLSTERIILLSITTSLLAAITELICIKGVDNLTVPLVTLATLLLFR